MPFKNKLFNNKFYFQLFLLAARGLFLLQQKDSKKKQKKTRKPRNRKPPCIKAIKFKSFQRIQKKRYILPQWESNDICHSKVINKSPLSLTIKTTKKYRQKQKIH